jgi:hypothetical protein
MLHDDDLEIGPKHVVDNNKTVSITEDAKIKVPRGAWQKWIEVVRIGFILL